MRILAHDFKNHLIQIGNCSDIQEVKKYIKNIYSDVEDFVKIELARIRL